jgi:hypothetical protein
MVLHIEVVDSNLFRFTLPFIDLMNRPLLDRESVGGLDSDSFPTRYHTRSHTQIPEPPSYSRSKIKVSRYSLLNDSYPPFQDSIFRQ